MSGSNLAPRDEMNVPSADRGWRKWAPLFVLSLALAIIIIDSTLLNVSLSTLIRELHTNLKSLQWVISAYSLTLAALTVTGGRMGDLFGRRRMFRLGAILFAAGSVVASLSNSVPVLLAGESIIEGIGAALMMPATASLLVARYHGHERAIAFGIWGGIAAAASAIGPILGGFLTTHYSWRWGFRINVVVVAVLLAGSIIVEDTQPRRGKGVDWLGVVLSGLGLFLVVFGIIESSTYGWVHATKPFDEWGLLIDAGPVSIVLCAIVAGLIILALFAIWERRLERTGGTPIVSMGLFRNQQFLAGALTTAVLMLSQSGVIFSLPVFLQSVMAEDAFHTGLSLLPMSIMILVMSPLAGVLTKRISPKRLIQTGLSIDVVALLIVRQSMQPSMTLWHLVPGLALYGAGLGLVFSQVNNLMLSAVPVREAGEASGVGNTFRQVGRSLGAAMIGAILLTSITTNLQQGVASSAAIAATEKPALDQLLLRQSSSLAFSGASVFGGLSPATRAEMLRLQRIATTDAIHESLLYGALFALLGVLVSSRLPERSVRHDA